MTMNSLRFQLTTALVLRTALLAMCTILGFSSAAEPRISSTSFHRPRRQISSSSSSSASRTFQAPTFTGSFPTDVRFVNTRGLLLHCPVYGRPAPVVQWIWSGDGGRGGPITAVPGVVESLSNGSLLFPAFADAAFDDSIHGDSRVRCRASNSAGTVVSQLVHIRAFLLASYRTNSVRVNDVYVTRGNTAVIQCSVDTYYVRDYVTVTSWSRGMGGDVIRPGGRYSIMSNGDLHIRDVTSSDNDEVFRCRTLNSLTEESNISSPGKLLVIDSVKSAPALRDTPTSLTVRQGSRVELPCVASAFPLPRYKWTLERAGAPAGDVSNVTSLESATVIGGNLVFESVRLEDAGVYVCTALNELGQRSTRVSLDVTAQLSATVKPEVQRVDIGGSATFDCVISGRPKLAVTWYKDGVAIAPDIRFSLSGDRRSLTVMEVRREDSGVYQCLVDGGASGDNVEAASQLIIGASRPFIFNHFDSAMYASLGSKVTLSCSSAGSPDVTITWSRDDEPLVGTAVDDRYFIENDVTRDGDAISYVTVSGVRVEDGGVYRCTATNDVAVDTRTGKLYVDAQPFIRPMKNVTAVASELLLLRCFVSGNPNVTVTWSRGGASLPLNHRQLVQSDGTLHVDAVDRAADDGWYTCHARDVTGFRTNRSVFVSVMEPPRIDAFAFGRRKQWDRVSVSCVVSSGDLPINITWTKNAQPINLLHDVVIQLTGSYSSVLSIVRAEPHHNGNYTCTAANTAALSRFTAPLHVQIPPRWVVEPRHSFVVLGQRVLIGCQVSGDPSPTVVWKKDADGTQQQRGNYRDLFDRNNTASGHVQQLANGSLLVDGATRDDAGYLLCQASNGVGADISKVVQLVVHIPARFLVQSRNYTARLGDPVSLECTAEGDQPLSIGWSFNYNSINWQTNTRLKAVYIDKPAGERTSRLTVNATQRGDSGFYVCTAKNDFGTDISTVRLVVVEPPDPPTDVRQVDIGTRSVELRWTIDFDGNDRVTSVLVELCSETGTWNNPSHSIRLNGSLSTTVIGGLHPAVMYGVRIRAENSIGLGNSSDVLTITTKEEEPTAPPSDVQLIATGSQTLKVTWKPPPPLHHNGRILGYYVSYKRQNWTAPYSHITIPAERPLSCELQELNKFTVYEVHVQAYNSRGAGPASVDAVRRTLEDVPSESPQDVKVTALKSHSLLVSWSAPPAQSQHGIILNYRVVYLPIYQDDEDEQNELSLTTRNRNIIILGLRAFTNYSVKVLAMTSVGEGVASLATYVSTLPDIPEMPADIKAAAAGNDSILVAWRPPLHANGILIKYMLKVHDLTGHKVPDVLLELLPTQHSHIIANLSIDYQYGFSVAASTIVGIGPFTREFPASPANKVRPQIMSFSRTYYIHRYNTAVLPCNAVGLPQPSVSWKIGGTTVANSDRVQVLYNGSLLLDTLESSDAGDYTCRAENTHGADEITVSLVVQAPPPAPILYISGRTLTSIQVSWLTTGNGASRILGFHLYYKHERASEWTHRPMSPGNRSHVVDDLLCGSKYSFYIQAFNRLGESELGNISHGATIGSAPIPPESEMFVEINTTHVVLAMGSWKTGGCAISSFDVDLKEIPESMWHSVGRGIMPNVTLYRIDSLSAGSSYIVRMTAHNDAGSNEREVHFETYTGPPGRSLHLTLYEHVNFMIPIMVAAVFVVVIIFLSVCISLLCHRRQRRRQRGRKSEDSKDHTTDTLVQANKLTVIAGDVDSQKLQNSLQSYVPENRQQQNATPRYITRPSGATGSKQGEGGNCGRTVRDGGNEEMEENDCVFHERMRPRSASCGGGESPNGLSDVTFSEDRLPVDSLYLRSRDGCCPVHNVDAVSVERPIRPGGSSLSSDEDGNINPYATFPFSRVGAAEVLPTHSDVPQRHLLAALAAPQPRVHTPHQPVNIYMPAAVHDQSSYLLPEPPPELLENGHRCCASSGIILNPQHYRLPSDGDRSGISQRNNRLPPPPPPIRKTPSLRVSAPCQTSPPEYFSHENDNNDYLVPLPLAPGHATSSVPDCIVVPSRSSTSIPHHTSNRTIATVNAAELQPLVQVQSREGSTGVASKPVSRSFRSARDPSAAAGLLQGH